MNIGHVIKVFSVLLIAVLLSTAASREKETAETPDIQARRQHVSRAVNAILAPLPEDPTSRVLKANELHFLLHQRVGDRQSTVINGVTLMAPKGDLGLSAHYIDEDKFRHVALFKKEGDLLTLTLSKVEVQGGTSALQWTFVDAKMDGKDIIGYEYDNGHSKITIRSGQAAGFDLELNGFLDRLKGPSGVLELP